MRLFYDDEFDALSQTIVNSERSFKECAAHLFPHLKPESQYARLKNCLNPEKDERLSFGQIVALCRFCSCFDALYFMADELQHARPVRKAPDDERNELMREVVGAAKTLDRALDRLEKLTQAPLASVKAAA